MLWVSTELLLLCNTAKKHRTKLAVAVVPTLHSSMKQLAYRLLMKLSVAYHKHLLIYMEMPISNTHKFHLQHQKEAQSNLGTAAPPPITQSMDSSAACATSCAIPTADESNHSDMGMLHHTAVPHSSCMLH